MLSDQRKGKFAVIINDITENINDNKIISENNNMLNLAMDTANMAWWDLNLKSGNVIFNNRKTDMLGFNAEDFKHYMDFVNIVHPDDKDKAMQAMQDHIDGKSDKYDVDYRIKTSTGDYKWFRDIGKIVKSDENGKPVRVTGLVTDISEMKKNEEELIKLKSELKSE